MGSLAGHVLHRHLSDFFVDLLPELVYQNYLKMADLTSSMSIAEMNNVFFEGAVCPYQLYIADSKMAEAGFGLFVREEVQAGKEMFRVTPVVSAVLVSSS